MMQLYPTPTRTVTTLETLAVEVAITTTRYNEALRSLGFIDAYDNPTDWATGMERADRAENAMVRAERTLLAYARA